MEVESSEIRRLKDSGLQQAEVSRFLARYRNRLTRMISLRIDPRLRGRLDPSDVIQEAYMEACQRLGDFLQNPEVPFYVWLRFITAQKLIQLQQRHLGVQARDVRREISLSQGAAPHATSAAIAARLARDSDTPGVAAVKAEMRRQLQAALDEMDDIEREVLSLRHFEQLKNAELAQVLGISQNAASKRYFRALDRLRRVLTKYPAAESL